MENGLYLDIEAEQAIKENETMAFKTNFNFLKQHRGWRKGNIHIVLGKSGGGKSTLVRSLVLDFLTNQKKLGVFLSEESIKNFKRSMYQTGVKASRGMANLLIESEQDLGIKRDTTLNHVKKFLKEANPDAFIFDNITTSKCYPTKDIQLQQDVITELKEICAKMNIPFILIAHTKKEVPDYRLIMSEDIRGNSSAVNYAEYFYVLQQFEVGKDIYSTLRITKSRNHVIDNRIFSLFFDKDSGIYLADTIMNFDQFKEKATQRNRI